MPTQNSVMTYPEFQPNQVLADDDLNQLRSYLDRADRETRVHAIGTGILCGLVTEVAQANPAAVEAEGHGADDNVPYLGTEITLHPGAGITSEGHLLVVHGMETFNTTVPYQDPDADEGQFPFSVLDERGKPAVRELIWSDGPANRDPEIGIDKLVGMQGWEAPVLVLYLEFKAVPRLKCSYDDCDDKGVNMEVRVRKLLVPHASVPPMDLRIEDRRNELRPLRMGRVLDFGDPPDIAGTHDAAARAAQLLDALARTLMQTLRVYGPPLRLEYSAASPFHVSEGADDHDLQAQIRDAIVDALDRVQEPWQGQLGYDLMRDLVSATNTFVHAAGTLRAECCPPRGDFPRYLCVGQPLQVGQPDSDALYRHLFKGVPALLGQEALPARLSALHRRIEGMIVGFAPALVKRKTLCIRPQEGIPLSPEVVPCYYDLRSAPTLEADWNAAWWDPDVPCLPPTTFDSELAAPEEAWAVAHNLDDRPFLRIEGHLGQAIEDVLARLEELRHKLRLPFEVLDLDLGDPEAVPPPQAMEALPEYDRLNATYWSDSETLRGQLRHVAAYLNQLPLRTHLILRYVPVALPDTEGLISALKACMDALPPALSAFDTGLFRDRHGALMDAARQYVCALHRFAVEAVCQPLLEATDPGPATYHVLVGGAVADCRQWVLRLFHSLDINPLLSRHAWIEAWPGSGPRSFGRFAQRHSAAEHIGGVTRGGTFALVQKDGQVVADFSLPYRCCPAIEFPEEGAHMPPQYDLFIETDLQVDAKRHFAHDLMDLDQLVGRVGASSKSVVMLAADEDFSLPLDVDGTAWILPHTGWAVFLHSDQDDPKKNPPVLSVYPARVLDAAAEFPTSTSVSHGELALVYAMRSMTVANAPTVSRTVSGKPQDVDQMVPCFSFVVTVQASKASTSTLARLRLHVHVREPVIIAGEDLAVTVKNRPVRIPLLSNDLLALQAPELKITGQPVSGTLDSTPDPYVVTYVPRVGFVGRDSFTYSISFPAVFAGHTRVASQTVVSVHVTDCCPEEEPEAKPPPPDIDLPYEVFCSGDKSDYDIVLHGAVEWVEGPGVRAVTVVNMGRGSGAVAASGLTTGGLVAYRPETRALADAISTMRLNAVALPAAEATAAPTAAPSAGNLRLGTTDFPIVATPSVRTALNGLNLDESALSDLSATKRYVFNPSTIDPAKIVDGKVTLHWAVQNEAGQDVVKNRQVAIVQPALQFQVKVLETTHKLEQFQANVEFQYESGVAPGVSEVIYHWSFGDNHFSSEQNPTHLYSFPALKVPWEVPVQLTVKVAKAPDCTVVVTGSVNLGGSVGACLEQVLQLMKPAASVASKVNAELAGKALEAANGFMKEVEAHTFAEYQNRVLDAQFDHLWSPYGQSAPLLYEALMGIDKNGAQLLPPEPHGLALVNVFIDLVHAALCYHRFLEQPNPAHRALVADQVVKGLERLLGSKSPWFSTARDAVLELLSEAIPGAHESYDRFIDTLTSNVSALGS